MIIAVAYDNGCIHEHFGHCPMFAIYESDPLDSALETKKLVEVKTSGHEGVAELMGSLNADVVICGNIGEGGRKALAQRGIVAYAGFAGDADSAAEMMLAGELPYIPEGGACAHHHDGGCCCHDDGGQCGGCHDEDEHEEGCGCGH